ncbi:uncharacterized protein KGF55_004368 [Candida pseudojiufengensis]|uniref:uncharacterized protein n=1 Tax=Candida pseudojiufengensis TaxID=497109 RepID=UPI0022240900|nr:uncharacterized protein KGF55_004368 [Candida pseudojiufengensis]KAI5960798.1 hypothetical protein KGF55_004368 [Candida pseudojiufengensis]
MLQRYSLIARAKTTVCSQVRYNSSIGDKAKDIFNKVKEPVKNAVNEATKTTKEQAEKAKEIGKEESANLLNQFKNEKNINSDVINKYKHLLEKKAKELGINNLDELKEKYKDEIEKVKFNLGGVDPLKEFKDWEKQQHEEKPKDGSVINISKANKEQEQLPFKVLNDFIDVDKAKDLPTYDIKEIWKHRFANKDRSLHATLDSKQFADIYANAHKYPYFVLPLPKPHQDGHELEFVQWAFVGPNTTHCLITTLAEYKINQEFSRPHTILTFHQEFNHDKDLVLMNGICEKESGLTMPEAHLLVLNLQQFYGGQFPEKEKLLKEFNEGSDDFSVEKLIENSTTNL